MALICKSFQLVEILSDFDNFLVCRKHVTYYSHLLWKGSGDDTGEGALEKGLLKKLLAAAC